jgi:hypothetical protein
MVQRLFLYGVDMPGAGLAIDERIEGTTLVLANTADAPFTVGYGAVVPAKITVYLAVLTFLVKGGFFHGAPFSRASASSGAAC